MPLGYFQFINRIIVYKSVMLDKEMLGDKMKQDSP
jgi:hypothetical protein